MKTEIKVILLFLGFLAFTSTVTLAQCKDFTRNSCKPELAPYTHDGIFNTTQLTEGETIELYKTFYADQDYRLLVCGSENLPTAEIQVLDFDRNVLFDNTEKDLVNKWDFKLKETQMVVISVVVPSSEEIEDEIQQGCLSIMIGFRANLDEKL